MNEVKDKGEPRLEPISELFIRGIHTPAISDGWLHKHGLPNSEGGMNRHMKCKFCEATDCELLETTHNINTGDDVIPPHAHINFIFHCPYCDKNFVVRIWFPFGEFIDNLYYGDIDSKQSISDISFETQKEIKNSAPDGTIPTLTYRYVTEAWKDLKDLSEWIAEETKKVKDYLDSLPELED